MINSRQFNADLSKFSRQIGASVKQVTKLAALKVFEGVVKRTPVDKGVARGAWVIGIGGKPEKFIAEKGASESDVLIRATSIRAASGASEIFVSNYVPYIKHLEDGTSMQAPEGMAAVTLEEVSAELKAATR